MRTHGLPLEKFLLHFGNLISAPENVPFRTRARPTTIIIRAPTTPITTITTATTTTTTRAATTRDPAGAGRGREQGPGPGRDLGLGPDLDHARGRDRGRAQDLVRGRVLGVDREAGQSHPQGEAGANERLPRQSQLSYIHCYLTQHRCYSHRQLVILLYHH